MKKLIMTCVLLTSASLVSFAQTAAPAQTTATMQAPGGAPHQMPTPEERAQRHAQGVQKQLNLTADQYKVVYEAELEMNKKVEELRKSTPQPSRDQFMAISATKDEKIKKVLTPEQLQKYQLMTNRQHPAPAPGMAPGQPTTAPATK